MFKKEVKSPRLLCETHKKDSIMFCKEHREWICVECLASHLSHYDKLVTSEQIFKVLKKKRDFILEKIDRLNKKVD